jgi:3-keto-disaccharide hydrolase
VLICGREEKIEVSQGENHGFRGALISGKGVKSMRYQAIFMSLAVPVFAQAPALDLFNGKDLTGWRSPWGLWSAVESVRIDPANPKDFIAKPGKGVMLNSAGERTLDALTEREFGDCKLFLEFCVPKDSNSGVFLMSRYEVQIFDSYGKEKVSYGDCGGIYERSTGGGGHAPNVNASKPAGEWQSFEITFRAPQFDAKGRKTANAKFIEVKLNDKIVHTNIEVEGPTRAAKFNDEKPKGPLMLQGDHGPVAFRNLRIEEVTQQ